MINYFNITPANIKSILNPTNNATGILGSNSAIKTTDIEEIILMYTSFVVDRLPDRYKRLITTCDEWLCGKGKTNGGAVGGETTFTTSLKPISNLQLYKNYKGNWANRKPSDRLVETTDYTVNETTGEITLTEALVEGETLIAYYDHSGLGECYTLRLIIINLVVAYLCSMIQMNAEKLAQFTQLRNDAYIDLSRLREDRTEGSLKLKILDDIYLVNETDTGDDSNLAKVPLNLTNGISL